MLESGSINRLPVKYRMFLAVSVALLIHTLVAASLSLAINPPERPRIHSLNIVLVKSGHKVNQTSPASTPTPATPKTGRKPETITVSKPQLTSRKSAQKTPDPAKPANRSEPDVPHRTTTASPTAVATAPADQPGDNSPVDGPTPDTITQVTPPTSQDTPAYIDKLVSQIATEAGKETLKVPRQSVRQDLRPLELELKLMPNGTLVRADIIASSGITAYDQSILRSALRASPFPEPPQSSLQSGLRFRITIYLEPSP